MFWLARAFGRPEYAVHEQRLALRRPQMFDLIWCADQPPPTEAPEPELDQLFRKTAVACFRSAWNDPNAVYLGFKAGANSASHAHLDVGSFVLESQGVRWAVDLGPERYEVPGYFRSRRWHFFRARNESHNTLTLNGDIQNPGAEAPIVAFCSARDRAYAVADMSAAYRLPEKSLLRGVALYDRCDILIQDDIRVRGSTDIVWNMYTPAAIVADGSKAELTLRGERLVSAHPFPSGRSI